MKAIILERRGEWAAALREDGTVVKTRMAGEVGETVELEENIVEFPAAPQGGGLRRRRWARSAVAAALALVIAGGSATWYTTAQAASYISVDVDGSSVELGVNRLGQVIEVAALNADSAELAQELAERVKRKGVEEAVDATVAHLREKGYLDEGEDLIVGVTPTDGSAGSSKNKENQMTRAVERAVEKNRREDENFYVYEGYKAARNEARKQGRSTGTYFATQDFNEKLEELYDREGFGPPERLDDLEEIAPELTPPAWMEDWAHRKGYQGDKPGPGGQPHPAPPTESAQASPAAFPETSPDAAEAVAPAVTASVSPAVSERPTPPATQPSVRPADSPRPTPAASLATVPPSASQRPADFPAQTQTERPSGPGVYETPGPEVTATTRPEPAPGSAAAPSPSPLQPAETDPVMPPESGPETMPADIPSVTTPVSSSFPASPSDAPAPGVSPRREGPSLEPLESSGGPAEPEEPGGLTYPDAPRPGGEGPHP